MFQKGIISVYLLLSIGAHPCVGYATNAWSMQDTTMTDSTASMILDTLVTSPEWIPLDPEKLSRSPVVSLQQLLKNEVSGLYVQETTGEPGTVQQMFIRGMSMPLISPREVYQAQPLVVLDGIPLVGEHPFAYDI